VEPPLREVRPGHFTACHLYSGLTDAPAAPGGSRSAAQLV
jgi:hypothetical protein